MTEQSRELKIAAAAITDRGLSQKRPLNEDAFLADAERRIFAVADGVGGAQAGEVASQTALEVLDEAFRHYDLHGDLEDLMEIAIQRANSSIHQLSREHPKLSSMATTIVALHLDGNRATIGHVGDSRLYRISPDGGIHRETDDHSIVEEEVRAGRMTPEQAANHPSRNVISRALGAETAVEVDLKTIEVEPGTAFLLCTDGITRHIPDAELREMLQDTSDLAALCDEMKRRCYERGAEDNLTAIIVRLGEAASRTMPLGQETLGIEAEEVTLVSERSQLASTMPGAAAPAAPASAATTAALPPPETFSAASIDSWDDECSTDNDRADSWQERTPLDTPPPPAARANASPPPQAAPRRSIGGLLARLFAVAALVVAASAVAFILGSYIERWRAGNSGLLATTPPAAPTPAAMTANQSTDTALAPAPVNPTPDLSQLPPATRTAIEVARFMGQPARTTVDLELREKPDFTSAVIVRAAAGSLVRIEAVRHDGWVEVRVLRRSQLTLDANAQDKGWALNLPAEQLALAPPGGQ